MKRGWTAQQREYCRKKTKTSKEEKWKRGMILGAQNIWSESRIKYRLRKADSRKMIPE